MASLSITLHWGGEEEGLVECVAEYRGGFKATAKVSGHDKIVPGGGGIGRDAALRDQRDPDDSSISAEGRREVEKDVGGVVNITGPRGLLGDVCSLGDWRALLDCSRIAA